MPSIQPRNSFDSWWANRWLGLFPLLRRNRPAFFFGRAGYESQHSEAFGYTEARGGRVHDPAVEGGAASAIVVSRDLKSSFGPRIEVIPLPAPVWAQAIERLASRAQLLAELLSGRLPAEISSLFRDTGADLFPRSPEEMTASCTCRLSAPCVHVAALHYVLADAFDRDPWLLFELRGMPREAILSQTHALRRGRLASPRAAVGAPATVPEPSYDRCPQPLPDAAALPAVPEQPASALRALPEPADWSEDRHPADLLSPVLEAASRQAHRLIEQPGLIRSLAPAPAVDPLVQRVQRLPGFPNKDAALRLIECVALARRAGRGDDPIGAMEAFSPQLARPGPRLDRWREAWVTAVLRGQELIQLSWEVRELAEGVRTAALLALIPGRPTALSWVSHADDAPLRGRRKAERALLARLDALVPGGAAIEIVAQREEEDDSLEEYLDILGWDHALLDRKARPDGPLSPTLRALLARRSEGAACFLVPEPRVAPETLVGVAAAPLDGILWLQVIARELVRELGTSPDAEPAEKRRKIPTDPVIRGAERLDALLTMDDRLATAWLSSTIERLVDEPWFLGFFRSHSSRARRP